MEHVHQRPLTRVTLALSIAMIASCDSQFSPSYSGESLLTIIGSVEIAKQNHEALVIPALAYAIPDVGKVLIQEVGFRGQFPSNFRLDIYERPPSEAYINGTYQTSGEPRMAVGYITAVPADHADALQAATDATSNVFSCTEETCDQPCGGKGCLVSITDYCVADEPDLPCYRETLYCPTFVSDQEDCTVEAMGDPSLKESPLGAFAGFSQNYVVVFLEKPAAKGSVTAAFLGSPNGLPAGYGLYSVRPLTEDEAAANQECTARAEVRGAAGFNQEFGTQLETLNFDELCGPTDAIAPAAPGEPSPNIEPQPFKAPFCGGPIDEQHKVDAALDGRNRHIERAQVELGCFVHDFVTTRVRRPAKEAVSVSIGNEVQPIFWLR